MLRRGHKLGFALVATAFLGLMPQTPAQSPVAGAGPATGATAAHSKARAHRKKAAPDPPPAQAPAPPPTLAELPPTAPQVNYSNAELTIIAQNATLSQVLRSVQSLTGAAVEMPSGASIERVVGQFGPGQPRDVLNALLNGSKFNYIILGIAGDPGAVQKVILTTFKPASPGSTAQNNNPPPPEPQDEESYNEPEPQAGPPQPIPPQFRHRPNIPGRGPEGYISQPQPQVQPFPDSSGENAQPGAKTPEQLLQELQQMQQQQQQMQDQLNPANRQPPQ